MQDTIKVGKYINNESICIEDSSLDQLLKNILKEIRSHEDKDEAKKALSKLGLTRLAIFQDSAFIINYLLKCDNYKEKINMLSKKLDIYVDKKNITFSTIIDFSNEMASKMKSSSIMIARSVKDDLSEEELRLIISQITEGEKKVIDRFLKGYRNWANKVKNEEELYKYLKEFENISIKLITGLFTVTLKKIEEDKLREVKGRQMALSRKISIYQFKHSSYHRTSNKEFN